MSPPSTPPGVAPADAKSSLERGASLLELGELDDARTELERAVELDPKNPRAQNLLGLVYFKLGLLEAARANFDRLVEAHPEEGSLRVNLGLVLLRQGRLVEANTALKQAIALEPNHKRAHAYLGLVLYRRGDLQLAHEHFVKGGAHDFAKKVQERLSTVGRTMPTQSELLRAVATDGMEGIEAETTAFSSVDTARDGRVVRDEEAWEALVTHALDRRAASAFPPSSAPASDAFATGDTGPPPTNDAFREDTPRFGSSPWHGEDRHTPAPAAWPSSQTGFDLPSGSQRGRFDPPPSATASSPDTGLQAPLQPSARRYKREMTRDLSSMGANDRSSALETPSLAPSAMPEVVVNASLPSTDQLPAVAKPSPPMPSVIGGRPATGTQTSPSVPSAVPGFVAGPGARARLGLSGRAHLRGSVLVAASGRLEMREALRATGDDPLSVLEGHAVLHLRVPRCAVALREARDLFVMRAACMGFDDGFEWDHGVSQGLQVLTLDGTGSLLLDTRGPPMLLPVTPGHPVHAASEAVLAWSREVDPSALSRGENARLFQFRGRGYVLVAFPPDAHSDMEKGVE